MITFSDILLNVFHSTLFCASLFFFARAVLLRMQVVYKAKENQDSAAAEARLRSLIFNVLFQWKLFRRPMRGIMHAFIFYGFLAFLLHTGAQMISGNLWAVLRLHGIDPYAYSLLDAMPEVFNLSQATLATTGIFICISILFLAYHEIGILDAPSPKKSLQWLFGTVLILLFVALASILILAGKAYYESVLELFCMLILVAVAFFAARRWILRAPELDFRSMPSAIILGLISVLMLSTLIHSASWALSGLEFALRPIQAAAASMLASIGVNRESALVIGHVAWWTHIVSVYAFLVYIPTSKHGHLLFAPLNFYAIKGTPKGELGYMDLDNSETFGASIATEQTQSTLLGALSCIECGRCTLQCPAYRTGKPLNPKTIMTSTKQAMTEQTKAILQGLQQRPLTDFISRDEIWSCTTCFACVDACPVGNNQVDAIIEMRRNFVLSEAAFPVQLQTAFGNMERNGNPWGMGAHSREDWCKDLNAPLIGANPDADVLYWVGCAGSFDERNKRIARSIVHILNTAKVNFAILGNEEQCTGDSARRAGNEYLFQTLAQANVDTLNRYKVKKILTACPHCMNTLRNEYPRFGGNYEVIHHSEFIQSLLRQNKIRLRRQKNAVTFHDSCYLARYNDISKEPRIILKEAGFRISEPVEYGRSSFCCGAGGAQMWMEEKHEKVNQERTKQLLASGASSIATACPFCITMITDGTKSLAADTMPVKDIAEYVAEALL